MKIGKNSLKNIFGIVAILAAYFLLFHYVNRNDVISALLTSGSGASKFDVILSLLFIFLRLFIIVLLPGMVLAGAGLTISNYFSNRKSDSLH